MNHFEGTASLLAWRRCRGPPPYPLPRFPWSSTPRTATSSSRLSARALPLPLALSVVSFSFRYHSSGIASKLFHSFCFSSEFSIFSGRRGANEVLHGSHRAFQVLIFLPPRAALVKEYLVLDFGTAISCNLDDVISLVEVLL